MRIVNLVFVVNLFLLAGCGLLTGIDGAYPLTLENHALVERIWDVKAGRFVSRENLIEQVTQSEYILLGETHDNILHHQNQAWILDRLHAARRSSLVAFEMIDESQGNFIADKEYKSSDALITELNHVKTSWKYERNYKPVFDSALAAGYAIYPANLSRPDIMAIGRKGEQEIPEYIKPYLEKNNYTPEQEEASRQEIKMAHCGMENPGMTAAMMLTQRVKDAVMTNSLLSKLNLETRVLVAGSGHVRNDRGVPMYILREHKTAKILTIAWLEVEEKRVTIEEYAERWGGINLPFDYVWFTARVDRPDPCESFKRHMEKKIKKINEKS